MRSRKVLAAIGVTASVLLVGCADSGDDPDVDSTEASPSSAVSDGGNTQPTLPPLPDPQKALKNSLLRLVEDDTGRYEWAIRGVGDDPWTEEGVFDLSSRFSRYLSNFRDVIPPSETIDLRRERFLRFEGSTCWAHTDAQGLGMDNLGVPLKDLTLGVPAAVLVPVEGRGLEWAEDGKTLHGTTDLYTLTTATGPLFRALAVDVASTDRVAVDFFFESGRIVGWEASVRTLLEAVDAAGIELPPTLSNYEDLPGDATITANLTNMGSQVKVETPPKDDVVELNPANHDDPAVTAELEACDARH